MTEFGLRFKSILAVVVGGLMAGRGVASRDAMFVAMGWPVVILGVMINRADRLAVQIAELREQIAALRSTSGDG